MTLEARAVSYAYAPGKPVLESVSFEIRSGEVLYILGRNGSGKTTLMSCLSGILRPMRGLVLLDGVDIQRLAPSVRARSVGLIPQLHTPAFAYSVREMVLMGRAPHLSFLGAPGQVDYAIADEALERVGMTRYATRPYTELSGGERQLVMIARGLAQQCRFLLMDEPDSHLDPNNQHRVMEIVAQLAGRGLSFIISSHVPNNALTYADRVLLLSRGQKLAHGPVVETLTSALLTAAYDMEVDVIRVESNGQSVPRAVLPARRRAARQS